MKSFFPWCVSVKGPAADFWNAAEERFTSPPNTTADNGDFAWSPPAQSESLFSYGPPPNYMGHTNILSIGWRFPQFVQLVVTARRSGTGSGTTKDAAMAAAHADLGEWEPEPSYEHGSPTASMTVSGRPGDYSADAKECRFLLRWAPTYSSRAKIRWALSDALAVLESTDVEWQGAAGVTIGGVPTCLPRVPPQRTVSEDGSIVEAPIEDADWIYYEDGIQTLATAIEEDYYRIVKVTWSSTHRGVPFPEE